MLRHFLGVLFWSFISIVLFVNLFQYSGAVLPFYHQMSTGYEENSIFGFSSIFTFVSTIGTDAGINNGLNMINLGVRALQIFSTDDIATFFNDWRDMATTTPTGLIGVIVTGFFNLIKNLLVLPIVLAFALIVTIVGAFIFLWNLITIFFTFLLGGYNTPLVAVGNLPNAYMSAFAFY